MHSSSKTSLIVHSKRPFNAEPHLRRLASDFITARSQFYVRSHGDIPKLKESKHRLRVTGQVRSPLDLSMLDLRRKFERCDVTAVMQCAGNRRHDMLKVRQVPGDPWAPGAIGNAKWSGVALAELLEAAGADLTNKKLHVAFLACDECDVEGHHFRYAASIPMSKAASPEVLLAYTMNGRPLAPEHGSPLRAVVPGFAGVRSVKWLRGVVVQREPSACYIQSQDYKLFPSHVSEATADWKTGMTIYEMPLNSAFCEPTPYAHLKAGSNRLRGYAVVAARQIERVDVSVDSGRTWQQAKLQRHDDAPWAWALWTLDVDLAAGDHELAVRAWDSAGQTQPALVDDIWNFKGYLCASWHRINVRVD